jgi:hypothetical protein
MRKIRHRAHWPLIVAIAAASHVAPAIAQTATQSDVAPLYPPYYAPSQSSVYNQSSVYLPSPPIAQGQDMVRGSSGVSCQTAIGSGGPYVDIGVIGSQDVFNRDTASVYGRVVVPLGKRPKRPDCTKLYDLEISRMRMEIELLRMGLPEGMGVTAHASAEVSGVAVPASPVVIDPPPRPHSPAIASSAASLDVETGVEEEGYDLGDGLRTIFRLTPG